MSGPSAVVCGVSISHSDASIDQLEAVTTGDQQELAAGLLAASGVTEALAIETCNRVEAYVVVSDPDRGREVLSTVTDGVSEDIVVWMDHEESLAHLLRVAAGLESLVLGEDQILGQVRTAFEDARAVGAIGPVLEEGVTKAIRVGERARTETSINEGVVSLASAAVRLVAEKRGLTGATAVVLGAGEMGTVAAKRLADEVERLVIVNRSEDRAISLVDTVRPATATVEAASLSTLPSLLDTADVLLAATASEEAVLDTSVLAGAGETFVVDITRPRDVPPAADEFDHLTVHDLDTLETVTEKTREMRSDAADRVESIVEEEFEQLLLQYKRKRADEVISAMYESAERIKAGELERALTELDLDDGERAAVESMADAIVSNLLAVPTGSLRDAAEEDDWDTIHTAIQLFDPHLGPGDTVRSPSVAAGQSGIGGVAATGDAVTPIEDDGPASDATESAADISAPEESPPE